MIHFRSLICALTVSLVACSSTVVLEQVAPEPNINQDHGSTTISLRIEKGVRDTYVQDGTPSMIGVEVRDWHKSLRSAFRHSFRRSIPTMGNHPDLTIRLLKAEFSIVPAAVTSGGQAAAVRGSIRYQANLVARDGTVVRRIANTAFSKRGFSERAQVSVAAADAIETMFEEIAAEFFAQ